MEVNSIWQSIVHELEAGVAPTTIAARFHNSLAALFTETVRLVAEQSGIDQVVLSGGVFNNQILLKLLVESLTRNDMKVYVHRQVPAGDGGIALGQAAIASEVTD